MLSISHYFAEGYKMSFIFSYIFIQKNQKTVLRKTTKSGGKGCIYFEYLHKTLLMSWKGTSESQERESCTKVLLQMQLGWGECLVWLETYCPQAHNPSYDICICFSSCPTGSSCKTAGHGLRGWGQGEAPALLCPFLLHKPCGRACWPPMFLLVSGDFAGQ